MVRIILPARSPYLSAASAHHSGIKELSGPTKGATEAACHLVPKGRNRGKVRLIPSSVNGRKKSYSVFLFTPARISLCILSDDGLTSSVFQGLPANHVQVVAWWLLDAVGPVLLMRSGILRKSLPAQWQSNTAVEARYRGKSPSFLTI